MLIGAGEDELARSIDPTTLETALREVALAVDRARQTGRPIPVEIAAAAS